MIKMVLPCDYQRWVIKEIPTEKITSTKEIKLPVEVKRVPNAWY